MHRHVRRQPEFGKRQLDLDRGALDTGRRLARVGIDAAFVDHLEHQVAVPAMQREPIAIGIAIAVIEDRDALEKLWL